MAVTTKVPNVLTKWALVSAIQVGPKNVTVRFIKVDPGVGPFPHSIPPLMMLVITSWLEGLLLPCGVIQNHIAVLNDITASHPTKSGLFTKSTPKALPASS